MSVLVRAGGIAIGTAVGQGLVVLATPFLARVYSPSEFGALALLMTVSNFGAAVGCGRFDLAIPTVATREVRGLTIACLLFGLALGTLTAVLASIFATAGALGPLRGTPWTPLLLALSIVLPSTYQASGSILLRRASPRGLASLRASQGVLFCASAALHRASLPWSQAISFLGGVGAMQQVLRRAAPDEESWTEAIRQHWRFPVMSLPGAVLDVVGFSQCVWIISATYGLTAAGQYGQVQRLIAAPLMLASMSVGQVLLRRAAELADREAIRSLAYRILGWLCLGALVLTLGMWAIGPPVFRLMLGRQWNISHGVLVCVCVAVCVRACVSPLSYLLVHLRRFDLSLTWQALYFVSAASLLRYVAHTVTFETFVYWYALHELVLYLLYLAFIYVAWRGPHPEHTSGVRDGLLE